MSPILCDDHELGDCDNKKLIAEWKVRDLNESTLHFYCQIHTDSWLRIVHGHKVTMEPAKNFVLLTRSEEVRMEEAEMLKVR